MTVMIMQVKHSNIVCILDQNLTTYKEGRIYGTDITRGLLKAGFKGLVFICSANDECASVKQYLDAGATGSLKKSNSISEELVNDILQQCIIGFSAATQPEMKPRLPGLQHMAPSSPEKTALTVNLNSRSDRGSVLVDELHCAGSSILS